MSSPVSIIISPHPSISSRPQPSSIKSSTKIQHASPPWPRFLQRPLNSRCVRLRCWPSRDKQLISGQVKQLAAVEMRKRVSQKSGALWALLDRVQRDEIKAKLPELIIAETKYVYVLPISPVHPLTKTFSNLVRHSAARVIAAIAAIEVPEGTWPDLLPFLHRSCTSTIPAHREVGSYILFTVLENIVDGFQEHLENLFKLFGQLLLDPQSADVRITTVRFVVASFTYYQGR